MIQSNVVPPIASIDKNAFPISYQENETKGHSNTDFENCQKNLWAKKFSRDIHDSNSNSAFSWVSLALKFANKKFKPFNLGEVQ